MKPEDPGTARCPRCKSPVSLESLSCPACGMDLENTSRSPTGAYSSESPRAAAAHRPQAERFIPGRILAGRYRIVERVGQGGMGEVYRAQDLKLGQPVALKFLAEPFGRDAGRLEALLAEVRLARRVSHPNVCRVHDVEETDGMHFLSMEFVDGEDLASLLRRIGRLPADKAIETAREICAGLGAIHDRGVIHRDLKPSNVMIDGRGHARITDFGLAEPQGASDDPDMIVGTPAYLAPECLLEGRAPTVQSDLYSLGLVLYEVFTGRPAFDATTLKEMILLRREAKPTSPSRHQRDIDPVIERLILVCLEKDPGRRPPSALAVAASLPGGDPLAAAIAAGETPSPELVAATRSGAEGLHPAAAWTCLAALVAGVLLATALSPRTRVVPALPLPESPEAMAGRARALLHDLGFPGGSADRAYGYRYDEPAIERILAADRSASRWERLRKVRPPIVTFWYRESPRELAPADRRDRVSYSDPPLLVGGMVGLELDGLGRLRRLDAVPAGASRVAAAAPLDMNVLFQAAGLDRTDFEPVAPSDGPVARADQDVAYSGRYPELPGVPVRVEVAVHRGLPVAFAVVEPGMEAGSARSASGDPSERLTRAISGSVRPLVLLAAVFVGAWIARRNLRSGRGDRKRALRVAGSLMAVRVLVWLLGGHHTPGSVADQLASTMAWSLYDLAYGWIFYIAIEPYVRRLWPRVLTSWVRLIDGQHADATVGRDLLVGCLLGTLISLSVAGHQAAPVLLGAPPGRPDNIGYVENQLAALLGLRHQIAELLWLYRSSVVLVMGFVMILVMARIVLRNAPAAVAAAYLLFMSFALPKGEVPALNVAMAAVWTLLLLVVLMRFGLLAAITGMLIHATLQAAPLGMDLGGWPTSRTVLALLIVLGAGAYGFARSLGGRPAVRDVLAEG